MTTIQPMDEMYVEVESAELSNLEGEPLAEGKEGVPDVDFENESDS